MAAKPNAHNPSSRDGGLNNPLDEAFEDAADGAVAANDEAAAELAAERDRNLRLRADLENVRSRASRELADTVRYAALPMARDLLPVLDNVDRAIAAAERSGESGPLVDGIRLMRQQLATLLEQYQCQEIAALGQPFDPQFHAAILQQPSADVPADHVSMVTQSGYRLHDRVVRPAQVIVSSGPA